MDPVTRSGGLERFDGVQHAPKSLLGQLQIMAGLHPQPETFAEAEETAQAIALMRLSGTPIASASRY
jgi:hypothetical protein